MTFVHNFTHGRQGVIRYSHNHLLDIARLLNRHIDWEDNASHGSTCAPVGRDLSPSSAGFSTPNPHMCVCACVRPRGRVACGGEDESEYRRKKGW